MLARIRIVAPVKRATLAALLLAGCAEGSARARLYQVNGDLFALSRPPAEVPVVVDAPGPSASIDAKVAAWMDALSTWQVAAHVPGVALALVLDGKLVHATGLGVTRSGSSERVTEHTLFRAGSTSKLVTALAAMTLVDRGILDLDRDLAEVAPWFSPAAGPEDDAAQVTLRRALSHTAGIPDDNTFDCATPADWRLREYFSARAGGLLLFPPGAVYDYSNGGYALVGALVEEASGERFDDYLRDSVLVPSGMTNATFELARARDSGLASGHDPQGVSLARADQLDCAWIHPAGGLIASADDMGHLLETLLRGGAGVLRAGSLALMESDQTATQESPDKRYGLGMFTLMHHGLRVLAHPGGIPGYSALLAYVPERGFGVAVMANASVSVAQAAFVGLDLFLDLPLEPSSAQRTAPSAWVDYVGHYEDHAGTLGRFAVALDGGDLTMTLLGGQPGPISNTLSGVFWRDPEGRVAYFVTRDGVAERDREP